MTAKIDLAYAAGIIDGEGCVKIHHVPAAQLKDRNFPRYTLQVQVDMVPPEAVEWLAETFGGRLYAHKKNHERNRDSIRWYIISRQAEAFLKLILPYVKVKKRHVENALGFTQCIAKDPQKHEFYAESVRLNKRGKDAA